MITWNRLTRDLAQMLTTCPLYPSLLCGLNAHHILIIVKPTENFHGKTNKDSKTYDENLNVSSAKNFTILIGRFEIKVPGASLRGGHGVPVPSNFEGGGT